MNTITQAFDSRSMALSEPSTAPSAFSLWRWLGERAAAKVSVRQEADAVPEPMSKGPRIADDGCAAADPREQRHDR